MKKQILLLITITTLMVPPAEASVSHNVIRGASCVMYTVGGYILGHIVGGVVGAVKGFHYWKSLAK